MATKKSQESKKKPANLVLDRKILKSGAKKSSSAVKTSAKQSPKIKKEKGASAPVEEKIGSEITPSVSEGAEHSELTQAEEAELQKFKTAPLRYFEAVGRRKSAIARVRLFTKAGDFTVNDKLYTDYFPTFEFQKIVEDALQKMKLFGRFRVSVKVLGGGKHSQAEAVRHGLARCLIKFNANFRKRLKRAGFLRRDPRVKERKKFGLKKARRAPQWAKR